MDKSLAIETITPANHSKASVTAEQIAAFLHSHLDRFRDPEDQIMQCLDYALGKIECRRGFILVTREEDSGDIIGAVVVLETGMSGFVPDNLLVYIAVDGKTRGQGIGLALMEKAIETARGDLALHVEPDNPARRLYERIGFTSKYLEMRYKK